MKRIYFVLLNVLMSLCEPDPQNYFVPNYLVNKYGSLNPAYLGSSSSGYSGVKTKTKTIYPTKNLFEVSSSFGRYKGGCNEAPAAPMNAAIRCSLYSGCRANCIPNYQFPNGDKQLFITCTGGQWQVEGTEWETIPACEPICIPPCINNGICVAPNQCNCPENYSGPQCQFENKPCMNPPPMPVNSRRTCSSTSCTIACLRNHQFPDGSSITNLICDGGQWVPTRKDWVAIPDCEPSCNPPCQNGGNCLSFNVCQCPQDFRGPQCQYNVDACSARKLQFNGGYNCSSTGDTFSCTLSCPEGIDFEFPPASLYTCSYETGIFVPFPIPQCVFGTGMDIIPIGQPPFIYNKVNSSFSTDNFYLNGDKITGNGNFAFNVESSIIHEFPSVKPSPPPEKLMNESKVTVVNIPQLPSPGICFTWGGSHFKTFDGKVFSFDSSCAHTLVRDSQDNTFSIIVQNNKECKIGKEECYRIVTLYLENKKYILKRTENGLPVFASKKKIYPIPVRLPGIRAEMSAHYLVVKMDSVGVSIKWDGEQLVQVEVKENLWNRTEGLCGNLDGTPNNDKQTKDGNIPKSLVTLATSWQVDTLGETCNKLPNEEHACQDNSKEFLAYKAQEFCKKLLADKRFKACQYVMDITVLMDACQWDYCNCQDVPEQCACQTLNVYVRECAHKGITMLAKWRDEQFCPMQCTGGRVYMPCAPPGGQEVCGDVHEKVADEEFCEEGCYCPAGTVLHNSECITKDKCPCRLRGKEFEAGSTVPKDCNSCTCSSGKWICTQVSCGSRCSALGDPHYITFDGKYYDFMGQCSYYLVKHNNFSIEAENVPCAGAISQAMNFPVSVVSGLPSCTKTVTIRIAGQTIKLKQNHEVVVNGQEVTKIPYKIAGVNIRSASSIFLLAELPGKVEIWWDGLTRVYIDVPATFKGQTEGLCGTFNNNQNDDFLTPEGDIEKSPIPFANKWKTAEKCNDVPDKIKSHPCDINIQNKATAEEHCSIIKSNQFEACHWYVDPEPFYQDCLYDVCSCETKISKCLCPLISAYAQECALKGIKIDWRNDVRECGIHCPGGQKYQICGNSCTRTCSEVSLNPDCKRVCVEGCNCPEGEALDEYGECIPIGQCTCQYEGLEFRAGYKEVRPSIKGQELCTCINAQWSCHLATPEEIKEFPAASDLKTKCDASKNMEFTTCEPVEPVTCKNMHSMELVSASVCHPGCQCKEGFVLDSHNQVCVRPTECPCHHGGRSYGENAIVQSDCNTCKCKEGKWKCTERQCAAECSAWGDSHYKTFDGRLYDYQGQCDYVLAKGVLSTDESFDISIQNVPCGSLGVSCSKSVTIKVGQGSQQETLIFTRERSIPEHVALKRMTLRQKGLFVIVEASELGFVIHWDKGTRVYVKLDPRWKGKVKGLCGNYNDNQNDDFETPSGGVPEVSAQLFGDSWRLQSYCPEALEITDTCEQRPDRKVWAVKKCSILKSHIFAPCHSEVPVEDYINRCVFDTCACDQGGDCECLCTALAAYAQECNNKGIPIKWRNQELCPIQCDERCAEYSPCISTCPVETCDNLLVQNKLSQLCKEDACIEGCEVKPCPPDQVYLNSSMLDCVPRNVCRPVCLEVDGVTYYEGDLMEGDECYSCYCSRGQKSCKGQPCTTIVPTVTPTGVTQEEQQLTCVNGWTEWINQDKVPPSKTTHKQRKLTDIEPLPSTVIMNNMKEKARCTVDQMVDIECRTVHGHKHPKETGLDVECSLERGLICTSKRSQKLCEDFEIRVKCQCARVTVTETVTSPSEGIKTETEKLLPTPVYEECDVSHPNKEHPSDCHLFYQCSTTAAGVLKFVEKSCGPYMFYNPLTQICNWPASVIQIKPECGKATTEATTGKTEIATEITTARTEIRTERTEATIWKEGATTVNIIEPETGKTIITCPPGERYDECGIDCVNMCLYYNYLIKQTGRCQHYKQCEADCVSELKQISCPPGMLWANNHTCVRKQDCMCVSNDGKPVKPGTVVKETECLICQCIDNFYTCDDSTCKKPEKTTITTTVVTEETPALLTVTVSGKNLTSYPHVKFTTEGLLTTETPFIINTATPPAECDENRFVNLINGDIPLSDDAFTASSIIGSSFAPKNARLDSAGSWSPAVSDKNQYLQVNLGRQEPVYGVILKGSPLYKEFVTSYKVAYSPDGTETFSPVTDKNNRPQILRGPVDNKKQARQLFEIPIEAQIVRIIPLTWHNAISLQVELIGCSELVTSTTEYGTTVTKLFTKPPVPLCTDSMGVDNGMLADQQISVSSSVNSEHDEKNLKISGDSYWQPLTNSPTEWIQFDFLEPRNITGFVTKGGPGGWVTEFVTQFSPNGKDWNPLLSASAEEKTFPGNFDGNSEHVNYFDLPIQARFLKVIPTQWHENIEVRIEPLGCFEPYPTPISFEKTTPTPMECDSCSGAPSAVMELGACRCAKELYWDGENCVPKSQCPCMVGHIAYAVGTVFEKEDCSQCICKLGGVEHCTPKICEKCEEGLRSVVTSTCGCVCQPCEEGKTLCPTSNVCINSTLWCNGVEDCSDDELNCIITTIPETIPTHTTVREEILTKTTVSEVEIKKCPVPSCPPGYIIRIKKTSRSEELHSHLSPMFSVYGRKAGFRKQYNPLSSYRKGGSRKESKYNRNKKPIPPKMAKLTKEQQCPVYDCFKPPPFCSPVVCPSGYVPVFDFSVINKEKSTNCPAYSCEVEIVELDFVCNVTGRTFNTFDGTEFKYDICNHIIARDLENNEWDISLKKVCTVECSRDLIINHEEHTLVFHPDLSLEYDGYKYTATQARRIGSQSKGFMMSRLGDTLLFASDRFGFWIIWDKQANVKVGVTGKLLRNVDGLCGYFNNKREDDKRKPDGSLAKTTVEFGDSWGEAEKPAFCEAKACPLHIQNRAWEMCQKVKDETLAPCASVIDVDAFVSRCLETTCNCLQKAENNETSEDICRCDALESYVVDCLTANPNLELSDWRMQNNCPIECESPLVHYDCYQRRCEPSCETLSDPDACPKLPYLCFPGCYCPQGYVRKGDDCVLPTTCRDCECNALPHLQYITYDENSFTVNGNCVYVMTRDEQNMGDHKFQVLITNHPCKDDINKMCIGKVTILYNNHKIHILKDERSNKLKVIVDSERIFDFGDVKEWIDVKEELGKHITIVLLEAQVEVLVHYPSLGVSVKAPSLKYSGKLEGLCGDCNGNPEDDLETPAGTVTPDVEEFSLSWLYDKIPGQNKEQCKATPEEPCKPLPVESDPCTQLVDISKFGQCHPLLDPMPFIDWCKKDTCNEKPEQACNALEAYALECSKLGVCIDWRGSLCPAQKCSPGLEYKACGPQCIKTCDNIKDKTSHCNNLPLEGCFCPEGKVLLNDTCVEERMCAVCDEEGHHPGDVWQKDKCTNCSCEATTVTCETQNCPSIETVCEPGYSPIKVESKEEQCCHKFICIPTTPSPTCEPPQKLQCAKDQVTKLITKPDGCEQFVCECKPPEDCESVDLTTTAAPLEPGIENVLNTSGCCPFIEQICKVENCPDIPECPKYHTLENNTLPGKCCSSYDCVPPEGECIVDLKYTNAEEGGERPRNKYEGQQVLKKVNETWKDGPCRECNCILSTTGKPAEQCSITECPSIEDSLDFTDYILEEVLVQGQCCPVINRTACKYEDKTYQPGEKWPASDGDYCTTIECISSTEGIQKQKQTINCQTSCDIGWEYVPASPESKECCGSCKPVECVVDGIVHAIGEKWSSDDYCTNYFCTNINGSLQVQAVVVNCPEIPSELSKDYVFESKVVEGECCKQNKIVGCQVDGKEYTVGETWPSPDGDKCKSFICINNKHDEITKQELVETCNKNCSKGWEYKESESTCCGQCEQVACVVNDTLRKPYETWKSEDGCITYSCDVEDDQYSVSSHHEVCPNVDDCPPENIYIQGCCNMCNKTEECTPKEINPIETVGIVKVMRASHGECVNKEELRNFTECTGNCHSATFYNAKSGSHESVCSCCQATKYESLSVEMECEDGHRFKKLVAVPSACGCEGCVAQTNSKKGGVKAGVKTG